MPNYDLAMLITLDIGLAILGLLMTFVGIWAILRQATANTTYLAENGRRIAEIAERVDARLRRQYPDIDQDLR